MYSAFSSKPIRRNLNKKPHGLYRESPPSKGGIVEVELKNSGIVGDVETNKFDISYSVHGDKGPIVVMIHGVPLSKYEMARSQQYLSPFCRTIAFDLLGMGKSSKPLNYTENDSKAWYWKNDCEWLDQCMQTLFPEETFVLLGSDWGGGIAVTYASLFPEKLLGLILVNPIAFDGYPVNEIQAIGRASTLDADEFMSKMSSFDSDLTQILKTMVSKSSRFNQYNLRNYLYPYIDVNYEDSEANTLSMRLKYKNIKVLADRASSLSPSQLLPYDEDKNPDGVDYTKITCPVDVIWGKRDNMMPSNQAFRFVFAIPNADVEINMIEKAGHLVFVDKPKTASSMILNFLIRTQGKSSLADIYLGFSGIWKGDEGKLIDDLRSYYIK